MTSLMFLMYLAAMGVSITLERQARRQKREIALEYTRLGLPLPPLRPKIQTLEALLNIAIGILMLVPPAQGFWLILHEPFISAHTGAGIPGTPGLPGITDFYIVLLAAGLTLVFLGGQALMQNIALRRNNSQHARADRGTGPGQ